MDVLSAIQSRRSIRNYQQKPIEAEKIEQLIASGNNAPHVGYFQISVIENPDVQKEINDRALLFYKTSGNTFLMGRAAIEGFQPLYGAPLLFVFSGPNGNPHNIANTSCAATNVTIAASALGLGSCYITAPILVIKNDSGLLKKMGIPIGFFPICGVLIGYSSGDESSAPNPLVDNVNYCR
jgi:FMN reductase [NAD(P)H]